MISLANEALNFFSSAGLNSFSSAPAADADDDDADDAAVGAAAGAVAAGAEMGASTKNVVMVARTNLSAKSRTCFGKVTEVCECECTTGMRRPLP